MSSCPGAGHCPGCKEGGTALAILAAAVVGFLAIRKRIIAAGHSVEHGTDVLLHTTWEVIEWAAVVIGMAVGLAITIALLYGITVLARRYVDRHALARVARVPQTVVTSCTILPRSAPVPDDEPEPLAIERGPALLLALLAALGHEGSPPRSDHDQAVSLKGAQAFARRRLRNPELLMNGDDARDHRAGR